MFFFSCYGSMAASLLIFQWKEMFSTWLYFSINTMCYLDWYHYNSQICQYKSKILKCTIIIICFPQQCHFLCLPAAWAYCQVYAYYMSFLYGPFRPCPIVKGACACGPSSHSLLRLAHSVSLLPRLHKLAEMWRLSLCKNMQTGRDWRRW